MSTKNVQWSQNLEQAEISAGKRKLTLSACRNFVAPEVQVYPRSLNFLPR